MKPTPHQVTVATHVFLTVLSRAERQRFPNREPWTPALDAMAPIDRLTLLNAISVTIQAFQKTPQHPNADSDVNYADPVE